MNAATSLRMSLQVTAMLACPAASSCEEKGRHHGLGGPKTGCCEYALDMFSQSDVQHVECLLQVHLHSNFFVVHLLIRLVILLTRF